MSLKKSLILIYTLFLLIGSVVQAGQNIPKEVFSERRRRLMEEMKDGVAILKNSDHVIRNHDVNYYPYRGDSDFYYLTGFDEPKAILVLIPNAEKQSILFVQPTSVMESMWHGDLPGIEGAMEIFGADTAYPVADFERWLGRFLYHNDHIYFNVKDEDLAERIHNRLPKLRRGDTKKLIDVKALINELRIIKGPEEIELIRRAVDIVCDAHLEVMKVAEPGMYEYELEAIFSYVFEKSGARRKAFESIVASGPNATVLHYSDSNRQIKAGELVMMDMGAENQYYASDVTRVIPVDGSFSKEQKEIYEIVLEMEDAIINHMVPGNGFFDCLAQGEEIAKEGLYRLGLITDRNTTWQHLLYYFSYCGHAMGLDVHDVGDYGNFTNGGRALEPGMVFAIEPLLYVGENLIPAFRMTAMRRYRIAESDVDAFLEEIRPVLDKYMYVAARVEDDVLITENGNEVLSKQLPRTVKDIEKAMKKKGEWVR